MSCSGLREETMKHPCYSEEAHHKYARMHVPVAPVCNIQCNYCNRRYDCVNESRPGVTSEVLTPEQAEQKYLWVKSKIDNLSVVGIAGPGDALANWEQTKETFERIRKIDDQVTFCLSTNGLMLPEYADEIVDLGVHHVTITMNTLEPAVAAKLYKHVRLGKTLYQGEFGAKLLLENQQQGLQMLTAKGILVKVNIVMVKGINDESIPELVRYAKKSGAFMTNIMPLIPAPGSAFENFPQTSMKDLEALRDLCQLDMKQMRHCKQCRADAIGLLTDDRSQEFRMTAPACSGSCKKAPVGKTYRIAVTSKQGKWVDLHFGHATEFHIYESDGQTLNLVEKRQVTQYCQGPAKCDTEEDRKEEIAEALADCDMVLTMRIGYQAKQRLEKRNIRIFEYCYDIEMGVQNAIQQMNTKQEICAEWGGAS